MNTTTTTTNDERFGAPSASSMERLIACPASHMMQQGLKDDAGADAASGTRIHAVLEGTLDESELSAADAETADMCRTQANQVLRDWLCDGSSIEHIELRLGMTVFGNVISCGPDTTADIVFSGKADVIHVSDSSALVLDYKTGRNGAASAEDNAQLASLASLVAKRFQVSHVRVAIVAPWCGKPTIADYNLEALKLAESLLASTLAAVEHATPDDARAGDHCKYCKAKHVCSAYRDASLAIVEQIQPIDIAGLPGKEQRAAMFARAKEMPAEKLDGILKGLDMVERFVDAVWAAAKERAAEDPEFQRFWVTRTKKGKRSVSDVQTVFARLNELGVTPEQFASECSITIGSTQDLVRKVTGLKGKALDEVVERSLEGATETSKGSLELVPATKADAE